MDWRRYLLGLALGVCTSVHADVRWSAFHAPAPSVAPIFVDLDQDGRNELVTLACIALGPCAVHVYRDGAGGVELVDSMPVGFRSFRSQLLPIPGSAPGMILVQEVYPPNGTVDWLEIRGLPLVVQRRLSPAPTGTLMQVGDLSGDGNLQVLVLANWASNRLERRNLLDGSLLWQSPYAAASAIATQLDEDPALEIIATQVFGESARVYDGNHGGVEWTYPSGFDQGAIAGQFDPGIGVRTFATHGAMQRIFRSSPYSPLREFATQDGPPTAIDIQGDGVDELVSGPTFQGHMVTRDALSGATVLSANVFAGNSSMKASIGRMDPAGAALAVGVSLESGQPEKLRIVELPAGQVTRYEHRHSIGLPGSTRLVRTPASAPRVLVLRGLSSSGFSGGWELTAQLRDPTDGQLLLEASVPMSFELSEQPVIGITVAAPQHADEDIVLAGRISSGAAIAHLDARSLTTRWRLNGSQWAELASVRVIALASMDFDLDGVADVLALLRPWSGSSVRLLVLNGLDGSVLWQSVSFQHVWDLPAGLLAGDLDAEPGTEIVLALHNGVYAIDPVTRLVKWIFKPSLPASEYTGGMVVWTEGGQCRFGLKRFGYQNGSHVLRRIQAFSCIGQASLGLIELPDGAYQVELLSEAPLQFAAVRRGAVFVGVPSQWTPYTIDDDATVAVAGEGALYQGASSPVMLLGSMFRSDALELDGGQPDQLFASGFETMSP